MFLTGPQVVEAVTRERVTAEELGGPRVHARNGVAHLVAADDVARAPSSSATCWPTCPRSCGGPLPLAPPRSPLRRRPVRDRARPTPREVYDVRDVDRAAWSTPARCSSSRRAGRATSSSASRGMDGLAGRRDRQPAPPPRRLPRRRGGREGRLVRRAVRPLRPAARGARRHARASCPAPRRSAPASSATGPRCCERSPRARVPRVTVTLRQAYRWGAHRDELPRPRSDADAGLAGCPGRRHGRAPGRRRCVERREIADGADADALADAYADEHLPVERAAAAGHVDEVVAPRRHARAADRRDAGACR